jgi:hypothetical protein
VAVLLEETAVSDPAGAWSRMLKLVESSDDEIVQEAAAAMDTIAELWAEKDPEAAVEAVLAQEQIESASLPALFGIWAEKDRDAALAAVGKVDESTARDCIEGVIDGAWKKGPKEEVATWYFALPREKQVAEEAGDIFEALANLDSRKAEEVYLAEKDGETRQIYVSGLAMVKAKQNVAQARAWANGLPGPATS